MSSGTTPDRLRRLPQQQRSREKLLRVLDAAEEVLAREGAGAFTTVRIAQAAGISVGTLYRYFPDKEAIVEALALRYWGDDPNSDDLLAGPINPKTVYAAADGLHFEHSLTMSHELLNEDTPVIVDPDDRDEIYVGSRLLDPSGKTVALVESNRIVKESF